MRSLLALLVLWPVATYALAETCKYVDSEGRIIYSNVPVKRARKVTCFEAPAPPPQPSTARPAGPSPSTSDAGHPRIDASTQRQRDEDRRKILEDELAREQKALDDARRALSEQEAQRSGDERNYARVQERLKPLQEAVATHEKNIASLKQELASSK
jgi:hypothetical protein